MTTKLLMPRRAFCGGLAASAGLLAASPFNGASAQNYPGRRMSVGPLLKTQFEYNFFPGAAGQIGYELYVKRRPKDGHNLLFGNMGPEMIMYATQKPDYNFPRDFIYFSMVDIDDSIVFASRTSNYKSIEQVVDAAKKRPLNVAVSRIPHPCSIGLLALGEATKSRYNLVPYGGGNPTYIAVLNGEADIGALPMTGVLTLSEKFKVLGVFNRTKNQFAELSDNAPLINKVFGTDIPDLYSARAWAVHTEWADKNPKLFEILERTSKQAHESPVFKVAYEKTGAPSNALFYGDREACTKYAMGTIELTKRYEGALTAKKGRG
jgi:tripartite-type tricarboxylate transporter receptor subunit TctC